MKKALSAAIAAALVLLTIGAGVLSMSLGRIVKTAVETAGPRLLGAPVTVGLVAISPWSGRGTLHGLVVGNPAGFKSPAAASVGSVEVEVKLSSLFTDTIVVERLAVKEPELTWEIGPDGSNLTKLSRNAEASSKDPGGSDASSPAAAKKGKSLLIVDFSVTGGKVGLSATALGGQALTAALPDVHLANVGGPGRSPAEAAAQAFGAITSSAQGAVANLGGASLERVKNAALNALSAFFKRNGK